MRRRLVLFFFPLLAIMLLVAGCGSGSSSGGSGGGTQSSDTAVTDTTEPTPTPDESPTPTPGTSGDVATVLQFGPSASADGLPLATAKADVFFLDPNTFQVLAAESVLHTPGQAGSISGPVATLDAGPALLFVLLLDNDGTGIGAVQLNGEVLPDEEQTVTVDFSSPILGIEVVPNSATLQPGETLALTCFMDLEDGTVADLTYVVGWITSDETVATVANDPETNGTVTALAEGEALVECAIGGVFQSGCQVTVANAKR